MIANTGVRLAIIDELLCLFLHSSRPLPVLLSDLLVPSVPVISDTRVLQIFPPVAYTPS